MCNERQVNLRQGQVRVSAVVGGGAAGAAAAGDADVPGDIAAAAQDGRGGRLRDGRARRDRRGGPGHLGRGGDQSVCRELWGT